MRDGRRQRLGLATGTANPNDEDVSTSGLGSLISTSDLFSKVLTDQNATTGNQAYLDRILDEQGPDTLNLDPGAYVDTRDNRYINDAYNYYLGGGTGDFADEVAIDTPATTDLGEITADGGGAGQATSGLDLGGNTDFEQSLLDQGIGVQGAIGDPVVAPGEIPVTQQEMDDFNAIPVTQPMTGGVTNDNITVENIAQNQTPYDEPMDMSNPGASIENIIAQQNQTIPYDPSINAFDINEVGDLSQNMSDYPDAQLGSVYAGDFDPNDEGTVYGDPSQLTDDPTMQETISNAFTSARQGIGDLATAGVDKIQEVGQSIANTIGGIYNGVDQTVSVFGKEINVPTTLAGIALNTVVGAPISLAFGALKAIGGMLPEGIEYTTDKARETGLLQGDNTVTQDIYGINTQSMFGDYNQYNIDRVEQLEDKVNKTPKDITELQQRKDYIESSGADGNIAPAATPTDIATGNITGDASVAESVYANEEPIGDQGSSVNTNTGDITDSTGNYAGNIMDEFAPAPTPAPAPAPAPAPTYGPYSGGGGRDSGGDGGGQQQSSGGGYNEGNFCFDPSTPIQMADGSTKEIKNIQLGDDTKGGEVTGVFQFKASDDIHNYRGVTVAGGHYVKENNKFIMVQDSPLAVKIDKIPVVYSLDTTGRRIFIKDIEFADYNGDGVAKNFLSNAGVTLEGFDKEVLRQVEQRLI